MNILEKIEFHCKTKKYCRITTGLKDDFATIMTGYILNYSNDFILIQETNDFDIDGFRIIPINKILDIRFNNNDKYIFRIHKHEGIYDNIKLPNYNIISLIG